MKKSLPELKYTTIMHNWSERGKANWPVMLNANLLCEHDCFDGRQLMTWYC